MTKIDTHKNRLTSATDAARDKKRKLFCAYITLGFPSVSFTRELIVALDNVGVDIIELGFPFSDPLADGPVIQAAAYESLRRKTTLNDAFTTARAVREAGCSCPLVFFSYYNPILQKGQKAFVAKAAASGFDAILCPDLPPEEDALLSDEASQKGLSLVYLIAPTTAPERMKHLAKKSGGFIYYVSRCGVTGTSSDVAVGLEKNVKAIKKVSSTSVLVGFGISQKKQIRSILRVSDGVIVGSAIIETISKTRNVKKVASFVEGLVRDVHAQ